MFPSSTRAVAVIRQQEALDTAARVREIREARRDGLLDVDPGAQRRLTAARLRPAAFVPTVRPAIG